MRLDMLERVDTVMRETGINSIVRADQPNGQSRTEERHLDESEPFMTGHRSGTKSGNRRVALTDENIEALTSALNRRMQAREVKSKAPLPH